MRQIALQENEENNISAALKNQLCHAFDYVDI